MVLANRQGFFGEKSFNFEEGKKSYRTLDQNSLRELADLINLLILKEDKIAQAVKIFSEEAVLPKQFNLLKALLEKHPEAFCKKPRLIALTGSLEHLKIGAIEIFPWESLS